MNHQLVGQTVGVPANAPDTESGGRFGARDVTLHAAEVLCHE